MKIYVASSWRNPWQPGVVALLRADGHDVYDYREPAIGVSGFSWKEIDGGWQSWTPERYREALLHPIAERGFRYDMDALETCDACVLVLPCGRSAHLELGWAAGARKRTAVLFPRYGISHLEGEEAVAAFGHTLDHTPCPGCATDPLFRAPRCRVPESLDAIEPELMAKMADEILLTAFELREWSRRAR